MKGYHVLTSNTVKDALKLLEEENISLILLLFIASGTSGYQLLEQIKSTDKYKHIPVRIFSEYMQGAHLGAEDYIVRPFPGKKLQE